MQNNSKITWKFYEISTTAPDGRLLKGTIHYWAKDYTVCMTEPFKAENCGHHLQYAVPVIYVTDEPKREAIHHIDLIKRGKEVLLALYSGESRCSL